MQCDGEPRRTPGRAESLHRSEEAVASAVVAPMVMRVVVSVGGGGGTGGGGEGDGGGATPAANAAPSCASLMNSSSSNGEAAAPSIWDRLFLKRANREGGARLFWNDSDPAEKRRPPGRVTLLASTGSPSRKLGTQKPTDTGVGSAEHMHVNRTRGRTSGDQRE